MPARCALQPLYSARTAMLVMRPPLYKNPFETARSASAIAILPIIPIEFKYILGPRTKRRKHPETAMIIPRPRVRVPCCGIQRGALKGRGVSCFPAVLEGWNLLDRIRRSPACRCPSPGRRLPPFSAHRPGFSPVLRTRGIREGPRHHGASFVPSESCPVTASRSRMIILPSRGGLSP